MSLPAAPADRPLAEIPFAILDVETTGLDAWGGDRICEVAIALWKGGRILDEFHTLVDPCCPISPGAAAVNKITPEMLVGAPRFELVAAEVERYLHAGLPTAHNASFDLAFVAREFFHCDRRMPETPTVDTLSLARRLYDFPSNKLVAVAANLGVGIDVPLHRARADVHLTGKVLGRMLDDLRAKGIVTAADLLGLLAGPKREAKRVLRASP